MAVFGYVRVSTDMQAEDGQSLDVQQRQLDSPGRLGCGAGPPGPICRRAPSRPPPSRRIEPRGNGIARRAAINSQARAC